MLEAIAPKDEIETALAAQMACTHSAALAMAVVGDGSDRRVAALGSAAARLPRAFTMRVDVRRRLRHGTGQYVRVEHVHIQEGGQVIIGNAKAQDGDRQGTLSK